MKRKPVRAACEGACETRSDGHVGAVQSVTVTGPDGRDWGQFQYCEQAIADDRKCGFIVEPKQ